jgi:hypothetical protein
LKVNCPDCNYNFAIGEGVPWCGELPNCQWVAEGRRHADKRPSVPGAAALTGFVGVLRAIALLTLPSPRMSSWLAAHGLACGRGL